MITAVDTNVLLDIIIGDATFKQDSRSALYKAARSGVLITSIVVYAEIAPEFKDAPSLDFFLHSLPCAVTPIDLFTAHLAGQYFHQYRQRGGTRTRILPDFLVAAHARLQSDRLLTRDDRFFGENFDGLTVTHPAGLG